MFLQFRPRDIESLFGGLKTVPRPNYIGLCKYRGGTIGNEAACYFIVELTNEEATYIALKIDMVIIKLPRLTDMKFNQNTETYYFE